MQAQSKKDIGWILYASYLGFIVPVIVTFAETPAARFINCVLGMMCVGLATQWNMWERT